MNGEGEVNGHRVLKEKKDGEVNNKLMPLSTYTSLPTGVGIELNLSLEDGKWGSLVRDAAVRGPVSC